MKQKINKREVIQNLVLIPENADVRFWQKEMSLLKRLEKRYSLGFLAQLEQDKVPTLAFLFADWKKEQLDSQYSRFYNKPSDELDFSVKTKRKKFGEDFEQQTPKTLKQFLS